MLTCYDYATLTRVFASELEMFEIALDMREEKEKNHE